MATLLKEDWEIIMIQWNYKTNEIGSKFDVNNSIVELVENIENGFSYYELTIPFINREYDGFKVKGEDFTYRVEPSESALKQIETFIFKIKNNNK